MGLFDPPRPKKKVYISGRISSIPIEEARATFSNAKKDLESKGYEVFSPFDNGLPESAPWKDHMRRDLDVIFTVDELMMLPGWTASKGAQLEYALARGLDIPIAMYIKN